MIEEDARLFARGLYRQKRDMAFDYALERAKYLTHIGDEEGNRVWQLVARHIAELEDQETLPPRPEVLAS